MQQNEVSCNLEPIDNFSVKLFQEMPICFNQNFFCGNIPTLTKPSSETFLGSKMPCLVKTGQRERRHTPGGQGTHQESGRLIQVLLQMRQSIGLTFYHSDPGWVTQTSGFWSGHCREEELYTLTLFLMCKNFKTLTFAKTESSFSSQPSNQGQYVFVIYF